MSKNNFSTQDVYELVDRRTAEIMCKFDALEMRVTYLESWKANLMGKVSVVVGVAVFVVSFFVDWIKKQLHTT